MGLRIRADTVNADTLALLSILATMGAFVIAGLLRAILGRWRARHTIGRRVGNLSRKV